MSGHEGVIRGKRAVGRQWTERGSVVEGSRRQLLDALDMNESPRRNLAVEVLDHDVGTAGEDPRLIAQFGQEVQCLVQGSNPAKPHASITPLTL